jgi:hypothetical protein
MWHPKTLVQRGGTGGNNSFTTERAGWQPEGGAAVYEMPPCPLRPPDAQFDPGAPQFAQAWWTVRSSSAAASTANFEKDNANLGSSRLEPLMIQAHTLVLAQDFLTSVTTSWLLLLLALIPH